ncbi:asparaginase domain-containing protein [Brevifollis gellanilyticus]|uniref:Asparaginase n=1 Tax=Brevifollis gellanilyticus TaxID=748831 RepID=A0A512M516_9BACT|nr:asparaginase domain-containing protein [Brevifollis gellanilyticus]GEP41816.1 asparaginase [Brevifollis gellanilyticus]
MKIHFIATGGTIDKVYFDAKSEYHIGSPQVLEVLKEAGVAFEYEIEPVLAKDSLEMTDADRQTIRERVLASPCERIVITHGTDTMADTGRLLCDVPGKTIVLTGAMQPARFRSTDATFNIGMAIGAVSSLPPGVYLSMNGRLFDPRKVRKNRDKQCFEEV